MNLLLSLFLVFIPVFKKTPGYVIDYHNANTKDKEEAFINRYLLFEEISIKGYVISLQMKQAKYKFFPWQKLAVFNKGKKRLEDLINKNPDNSDLRYLRLVIQENIPVLLNYKSSIKLDKKFLQKKMKIIDDSDYLDIYIKKNTSL
ncbi:hypothetical protein [Tenacibaculum sp. C7A-26P2]|uniref:hypothetical protein n=1 Tax=Tenacibaculum sp. C7A-26P2 TaxID=3447504 RepID=UPI003F83B6D8